MLIDGFTATEPRAPIGGVEQGGYGRAPSHLGLREFVNARTAWIKTHP